MPAPAGLGIARGAGAPVTEARTDALVLNGTQVAGGQEAGAGSAAPGFGDGPRMARYATDGMVDGAQSAAHSVSGSESLMGSVEGYKVATNALWAGMREAARAPNAASFQFHAPNAPGAPGFGPSASFRPLGPLQPGPLYPGGMRGPAMFATGGAIPKAPAAHHDHFLRSMAAVPDRAAQEQALAAQRDAMVEARMAELCAADTVVAAPPFPSVQADLFYKDRPQPPSRPQTKERDAAAVPPARYSTDV